MGILTQQQQKAKQDQADGVGPQPPRWLVSIPGPGLGVCTGVPVVTLTHLHSQVVWSVTLPVLSVCNHEGDGVPPGGQLLLLGGQQCRGGCKEIIMQINSGTGAFSLKLLLLVNRTRVP